MKMKAIILLCLSLLFVLCSVAKAACPDNLRTLTVHWPDFKVNVANKLFISVSDEPFKMFFHSSSDRCERYADAEKFDCFQLSEKGDGYDTGPSDSSTICHDVKYLQGNNLQSRKWHYYYTPDRQLIAAYFKVDE